MSCVNVLDVQILNGECLPFSSTFKFQITFECVSEIPDDLVSAHSGEALALSTASASAKALGLGLGRHCSPLLWGLSLSLSLLLPPCALSPYPSST